MKKAVVIAIDGPAAAGKGTLARRIADFFDYAYLDTGLLYRSVGLKLLNSGALLSDNERAAAIAGALTPSEVARLAAHPDLRAESIGNAASLVAAMPDVRDALLAFQRDFSQMPPDNRRGAVLDGRDIGTVVCPGAPIKLFVTANDRVRARRRLKELQNCGIEAIEADVLSEIRERDRRDASRKISPLIPAEDAFILDTSSLGVDEAFSHALGYIRKKGALEA